MRRPFRLLVFIALCLAFLAGALLVQPGMWLVSSRTRRVVFARMAQLWARALLRLIGMRVNLSGVSPGTLGGNYLLVGNHQSYLDIIIIASAFPILFVAKQEMGRWPMLGWLARLGGTIFIDREDAHSGVSCAYRASRLLRSGINVQVFPESTTNDGNGMLPFKALFFASAIRARVPVLPLTIDFRAVNQQALDDESREWMCWYGDADFLPHFWRVLQIDSAEVSLMVHQPIETSRRYRATALAQLTEHLIRTAKESDAMARRIENECAYCAEEIEPEKGFIGRDWKVYCSLRCVEAGESISRAELDQLMDRVSPGRERVVQDQSL
ncbi:MAG TPA: lysophospholipid acyltransferase family protein [Blastocatellia bacterium]|nr:lysophospholipid acyltransferase family protein [Blastocatellia bacterium]